MDPLTGLGIASAATSIIAKIIPTIFSVKEAWEGIKQVDETNTGFIEELNAFEFALTVIDNGIRKNGPAVEQEEWWNTGRMTDLLHNAVKTMSRLDTIFKDMSRERRVLASMRSYYRGHMYEKEIGHLTNRLRTYTSCLKLPMMISVISAQFTPPTGSSNSQASSTPSLGDGSDTLFENEIQETNVAIRRVLQDITEVCVSLDQRQDESPKNSVEDCQDLTEIAAKIVHTLSSVASNKPIAPQRMTHLPTRPTFRDWESASVSGVPLGFQTSRVLQEWSEGIEALAPQSTTDQWWGSSRGPMLGESQVDMNSQRIAKASSLFRERKFTQAVPWLEKSLQTLPEQHPRRVNVQLMLAKCLMEIEPLSPKAETLLSDVVNNSSHDQNAEALGLLAVVRKELYPNDLKKAKESCELAISARRNVFGRFHEKTIESISLMIHLCTLLNDIDATIWQENLPDDLVSPGNSGAPPLRLLRAFSPFAQRNSASQPDIQKQLDKIRTLESEIQRYQGIITEQNQVLKEEQETLGSALSMHNRSRDELAMTSSKLSEMEQRYHSLQSEHDLLKARRAEELSNRTTASHGEDALQEELKKEQQKSNKLQLELQRAKQNHDNQIFALRLERNGFERRSTEQERYHTLQAKTWEVKRQESRERMRGDHATDLEALKATHAEELQTELNVLGETKKAHVMVIRALKIEHDEKLAKLEASHKAELQERMAGLKTIIPEYAELQKAEDLLEVERIIRQEYRIAEGGWRVQYDRAQGLESNYTKVAEVLMKAQLPRDKIEKCEDAYGYARALVADHDESLDYRAACRKLERMKSRIEELEARLEDGNASSDTGQAPNSQDLTLERPRSPQASTTEGLRGRNTQKQQLPSPNISAAAEIARQTRALPVTPRSSTDHGKAARTISPLESRARAYPSEDKGRSWPIHKRFQVLMDD